MPTVMISDDKLPLSGAPTPATKKKNKNEADKFPMDELKNCFQKTLTKGGNVPQPFISFQATGFPSEILRESHFRMSDEQALDHGLV